MLLVLSMNGRSNDTAVAQPSWVVAGLVLFFLATFTFWLIQPIFRAAAGLLAAGFGDDAFHHVLFYYITPIALLILFYWAILTRTRIWGT